MFISSYSNNPNNLSFRGTTSYNHSVMDNIARCANKTPKVVSDFFELNKSGLSRNALFGIALLVILGARYAKARGNDERREILTRDLIGILAVFQGVPFIANFISKRIEKKSGFAVMNGKDAATYEQLAGWYTNKKNPDGFLNISNQLEKLGGNLKKIFKSFDPKQRNDLAKELLNNADAKFSDIKLNDKEIINRIEAIKDSKIIQELNSVLKSENNPILKKAKMLKAIPELIGVASTIALLGLFLPWYNIYSTNKKYAKLNEEKMNQVNNTQQTFAVEFTKTMDKISNQQKQLFAQFMN